MAFGAVWVVLICMIKAIKFLVVCTPPGSHCLVMCVARGSLDTVVEPGQVQLVLEGTS